MVEKMVVEKFGLIKELEKRLKKWKEDERISFEVFQRDLEKQDAICYNMLIAIQTAIDLGNLIIEEKRLELASSYAEIFEILARNKIINEKLARKLSSLARFRNVLAHFYWKINYQKVYRILKNGRKVLEEFLKEVEKF